MKNLLFIISLFYGSHIVLISNHKGGSLAGMLRVSKSGDRRPFCGTNKCLVPDAQTRMFV
jgi:hypothetical protein